MLCSTQHRIHAATPPHNKLRRNFTECFNINIILARLNSKLSDDGRRPKHVQPSNFNEIVIKVLINVHLFVNELYEYNELSGSVKRSTCVEYLRNS